MAQIPDSGLLENDRGESVGLPYFFHDGIDIQVKFYPASMIAPTLLGSLQLIDIPAGGNKFIAGSFSVLENSEHANTLLSGVTADIQFWFRGDVYGRCSGVAACGNLLAPDVDSLANDIELRVLREEVGVRRAVCQVGIAIVFGIQLMLIRPKGLRPSSWGAWPSGHSGS